MLIGSDVKTVTEIGTYSRKTVFSPPNDHYSENRLRERNLRELSMVTSEQCNVYWSITLQSRVT
jgi:hypothetical protein